MAEFQRLVNRFCGGRAGEWVFPGGTIPWVGLVQRRSSAPSESWGSRTATPTRAALRRRDPGRTQTRLRRVQARLPSPSQRHPSCFCRAAPAGLERHCREQRGPSASDGLGNRGEIRARFPCTDREHGGTQVVSRRSGSPREARSEEPKVLSRTLTLIFWR